MSKVDLRTLESVTGNDAAATALLNANFEEISEALDNAISRDGTAPNYMDANLDMNNKRLINLADPENDYDAINKKYFTDTIGNAASYASQAATSAAAAASSAQSSATSAAQAIAELQAAEATIQEAADRAIEEVEGRAEAEFEEYIENTVKPDLQDMVDDASSYATVASGSATLAERWATSTTVVADGKYGSLYYAQQADSANTDAQSAKTDAQSARNTAQTAASNSNIWAEGTDEQVQALGGVHSSKVWSQSNKRNIGEIVASTIPLTDAGLHLLDGSVLQGGGIYDDFVTYIAGLVPTYPDLFETEANWQNAVSTYGVCGKFVYDSVNNTVRLPKYSDKIYTVDTASTAPVIGNGMSIGVTNGTQLGGLTTGNDYRPAKPLTGAYGKNVGTTATATEFNANTVIGLTTDASKSGLIASLSNIIAPVEGYYYIVVATSTKTEIEVDIDQITADLANKADKNLANITPTQDVKSEITSWGMPSNNYVNLTLGASGSLYTAPTNGYFVLRKIASANGQQIEIINNTTGIGALSFGNSGSWLLGFTIAKKGEQVYVAYTAGGTTQAFRFIYAEGEI